MNQGGISTSKCAQQVCIKPYLIIPPFLQGFPSSFIQTKNIAIFLSPVLLCLHPITSNNPLEIIAIHSFTKTFWVMEFIKNSSTSAVFIQYVIGFTRRFCYSAVSFLGPTPEKVDRSDLPSNS